MAENKAADGMPVPAAPLATDKKIVLAETPGSMSLDTFLRKTEGKGIDELVKEEDDARTDQELDEMDKDIEARRAAGDAISEDERDVEAGAGEEAEDESEEDSEKEGDDESETDEDEETEGEEDEEAKDAQKKKSGKAKPVKVIGADGKEFDIPDDAIVEKQIDGKLHRISLKEALNVAAGEITVTQRLSKVGSFYEETKKFRASLDAKEKEYSERDEKILKFIDEQRPDMALIYLAEQAGTSPVVLYKKLLANLSLAVKNFEGKSPEQIDNWFLNLDSKWHKERDDEREKKEKKEAGYQTFLSSVSKLRESVGVSEDEFAAAVDDLTKSNKLSQGNPEAAAREAINRALHTKHIGMIERAVKGVNPKLLKNEKLLRAVYEITDPVKFSEKDIAAIVRDALGEKVSRVASNLSKKGDVKSPRSEKKTEVKPKKYSSESSLREDFGFTR